MSFLSLDTLSVSWYWRRGISTLVEMDFTKIWKSRFSTGFHQKVQSWATGTVWVSLHRKHPISLLLPLLFQAQITQPFCLDGSQPLSMPLWVVPKSPGMFFCGFRDWGKDYLFHWLFPLYMCTLFEIFSTDTYNFVFFWIKYNNIKLTILVLFKCIVQ